MTRIVRSVLIPLLLSVVSAEVTVRLAGFLPVARFTGADDPGLYLLDPQLGWNNRPTIRKPLITAAGRRHTITNLGNGARTTGESLTSKDASFRRDVIFIGCCFTYGFGLSDEETFAWKVQAARPDWKVHNFGVNGYGTCQGYMLLKRLFEREKWHKPVVIYGFLALHEERNVRDYLWHFGLSTRSSSGEALLPSCMIDSAGAIVFNPPRSYPQLPLRYNLAVIPIIEKLYLKFDGAPLARQKRQVTEQLLVEMEALTAAHSGRFGVLLFDTGDARIGDYEQFFKRRNTQVIGVYRSDPNSTDSLTQSDGHPDNRMTDLIAARVVNFVSSLSD